MIETISVLGKYAGKVKGVIHAFNGDYDQAKKYLDRSLYNGHSLVTYDLLLRILESGLNNKPTTIKEVCTQTTQSMLNTRKHLNHFTWNGG